MPALKTKCGIKTGKGAMSLYPWRQYASGHIYGIFLDGICQIPSHEIQRYFAFRKAKAIDYLKILLFKAAICWWLF